MFKTFIHFIYIEIKRRYSWYYRNIKKYNQLVLEKFEWNQKLIEYFKKEEIVNLNKYIKENLKILFQNIFEYIFRKLKKFMQKILNLFFNLQ